MPMTNPISPPQPRTKLGCGRLCTQCSLGQNVHPSSKDPMSSPPPTCRPRPPSYLQRERHEEVERGHAHQKQLEVHVARVLQHQQGFHEAQRVNRHPDHQAEEDDEGKQERDWVAGGRRGGVTDAGAPP